MSNTSKKTCSDCHTEKPLEDFPKRADAPDGRRGQCRECFRKTQAKWRENNRAKYNRYHREYKKANK